MTEYNNLRAQLGVDAAVPAAPEAPAAAPAAAAAAAVPALHSRDPRRILHRTAAAAARSQMTAAGAHDVVDLSESDEEGGSVVRGGDVDPPAHSPTGAGPSDVPGSVPMHSATGMTPPGSSPQPSRPTAQSPACPTAPAAAAPAPAPAVLHLQLLSVVASARQSPCSLQGPPMSLFRTPSDHSRLTCSLRLFCSWVRSVVSGCQTGPTTTAQEQD